MRLNFDDLPRWALGTIAAGGLLISGYAMSMGVNTLLGLKSWSVQHEAEAKAYRYANNKAIQDMTRTLDKAVSEAQRQSRRLDVLQDRSDKDRLENLFKTKP